MPSLIFFSWSLFYLRFCVFSFATPVKSKNQLFQILSYDISINASRITKHTSEICFRNIENWVHSKQTKKLKNLKILEILQKARYFAPCWLNFQYFHKQISPVCSVNKEAIFDIQGAHCPVKHGLVFLVPCKKRRVRNV